jgi:biotin carboxyl carrier protein
MSRAFRWKQGDRVREVVVLELADGRARVSVDGGEQTLEVTPLGDGRLRLATAEGVTIAEVTASGARHDVRLGAMDFVLEREPEGARRRGAAPSGGLEAPMPGLVTRVLVEVGETVKKGQPLVALEAMKMEHLIRAPRDGRVTTLPVQAGEMVQGGVALVEIGD